MLNISICTVSYFVLYGVIEASDVCGFMLLHCLQFSDWNVRLKRRTTKS